MAVSILSDNTFVTNFNADGQSAANVELMTDERGHMYPISKLFAGNTLGTALQVNPPTESGRKVDIADGYVQIPYQDYAFLAWLKNDDESGYSTLDIDAGDTTNPRYSAIVAYIDLAIQYDSSQTNNPGLMKITEVKGDAATTPVEVGTEKIAAALNDNPYIVLAQVYVPANATAITSANIIDKRTSITLREGVGLPYGSYATGVAQATGSSYTNPIQLAVINANDTVPAASTAVDVLVCRISQ